MMIDFFQQLLGISFFCFLQKNFLLYNNKMYLPLHKTGKSIAQTDDTKYPCPSLVPSRDASFSSFYPTIDYQNREYFEPPAQKALPENKTPIENATPQVRYHVKENFQEQEHARENFEKKGVLDPVMDCKFNFREICKQCILLEDHLTHNSKRCYDCCMKHFLALEALIEEAIQLDKKQEYEDLSHGISMELRDIQRLWHSAPEKNAHECAQKLRKIRKRLMDKCFSVVFDSKDGCDSGFCKKPSS